LKKTNPPSMLVKPRRRSLKSREKVLKQKAYLLEGNLGKRRTSQKIPINQNQRLRSLVTSATRKAIFKEIVQRGRKRIMARARKGLILQL